MKYQSLEGSTVIRKFSIIFLIVSIAPLLLLFFLYAQISDIGNVEISINNLQTAIALIVIGVGAGYLSIRGIFSSFINTIMRSREDIGALIRTDPDKKDLLEDNEVLLLKKTFANIKLKLENDVERLALTKRTLHSVLNKVSQEVTANRSLDSLLQHILETLTDALFSRVGVIVLVDKVSGQISVKAVSGIDPALYVDKSYPVNLEALGVLPGVKKAVLLTSFSPEITQAFRFLQSPAVFAPLVINENVLGGIIICSRIIDEPLQDDDVTLVNNIAIQIAGVIEREDLKFKANIDPLTGLFNYRHFMTILDYEVHLLKRYGRQLALLVLDVDDYKSFNDTFGHIAGNILLQQLAILLKSSVRVSDVVCRFGGDEFIILLPETGPDGLQIVAHRLKAIIAGGEFKKKVTLSGGAINWTDGMDQARFMEAADKALYRAKAMGKDQIVIG